MLIWGLASKSAALTTTSLSGDLLRLGLDMDKEGDEYSFEMGEPMAEEQKDAAKGDNRMTPLADDLHTAYSSYRPHLDLCKVTSPHVLSVL